jgi:hypothetical protein
MFTHHCRVFGQERAQSLPRSSFPGTLLLVCQLYLRNCSISNRCSLAEIILHHSAIAVQGCTHQEAVLAEHLLPETDSIPKRIEYQLATESESAICHIIRNTNSELMRHLCLNVDVDIDWQKTPEAIRKAILARISGNQVTLNATTRQWSRSSAINFRVVDFALSLCLKIYDISRKRHRKSNITLNPAAPSLTQIPAQLGYHLSQNPLPRRSAMFIWLQTPVRHIVSIMKWIAVLTGGASEVERELWYALRGAYINQFTLRVLLTFWRIFWLMRNVWIRVFIIARRPLLAKLTTMATFGASRELFCNMITVELPEATITGFACKNIHGNMQLQIYDGALQAPPADIGPIATAIYDEDNRLVTRTDTCSHGETVSTFHFGSGSGRHRWPVCKDIWEPARKLRCQYDKSGRIVSGIITLAHEQYEFTYHYKKYPEHNNSLLRADYRLVGSDDRSLFVSWCHSPGIHSGEEVDYDAIPSEKVTRVVRNISGRKIITRYVCSFILSA